MAVREQPLNLLDLPVDILALILTPLLKFNHTIELCPCDGHASVDAQLDQARSILLVHPHLHAVACPMLYSLNSFRLAITSRGHGSIQSKYLQSYHYNAKFESVRRKRGFGFTDDEQGKAEAEERRLVLGKLRLFTTESARRRVRRFELVLGSRRGWVDQVVTPVLADMVLAGNLAALSVRLWYDAQDARHRQSYAVRSGRAEDAGGDAVIFTKPPLAGLFRLLADPYLETAELFVGRGHPPAWCKYHEKTETSRQGASRMSCPTGVLVDWRAIVRDVLDPEGIDVAAPWTEDMNRRSRV